MNHKIRNSSLLVNDICIVMLLNIEGCYQILHNIQTPQRNPKQKTKLLDPQTYERMLVYFNKQSDLEWFKYGRTPFNIELMSRKWFSYTQKYLYKLYSKLLLNAIKKISEHNSMIPDITTIWLTVSKHNTFNFCYDCSTSIFDPLNRHIMNVYKCYQCCEISV